MRGNKGFLLSQKYTIMNFKASLDVIKKYDCLSLSENWMKSAIYFQEIAKKNINISDAIPYLLEIYRDSNNIGVMNVVGHAVIRHYLNTGQIDEIVKVIKKNEYPVYFLEPFNSYINKLNCEALTNTINSNKEKPE